MRLVGVLAGTFVSMNAVPRYLCQSLRPFSCHARRKGIEVGRYEGELKVSWNQDGRHMDLLETFAFIDGAELRWDVPSGARIDGASIPQFLWSITGSPYVGKYRDASVVHDWYCCVRTRTCDATHTMFHEAMLVSGVPPLRALIMYAAVRYAGPTWSEMDVHNSNLATGIRWGKTNNRWGPGGLPPMETDAYHEFMAKRERRAREVRESRAPVGASLEGFAEIAREVTSGRTDFKAISRINADAGDAGFKALPRGVFPFSDESPLKE